MKEKLDKLSNFLDCCEGKIENNRQRVIELAKKYNFSITVYDAMLNNLPSIDRIDGSSYYLAKVMRSNDTLQKIKRLYEK